MALTNAQAAELASMLPEGMRCTNTRERLLCLIAILRRLTDNDHTLSNADLRAVLAAYVGAEFSASENTIAADLHALQSSGAVDFQLHSTATGVWCEPSSITFAEARLLVNATQQSHFLTTEQSFDLQEDLCNLVSCYQEEDLMSEVLVAQRLRKDQQVFDTIDTVARAMRMGRKVEFVYAYANFQGQLCPLEGDNGNEVRCETPTALYFSRNYYVETYASEPWRHGIRLMRSRADRMLSVRVSSEIADECDEVQEARRSARERLRREFAMLDGPQRMLFLRVRSDRTNVFFDRFGFEARFAQFEGEVGEPSATGLTLVTVAQAHTFYEWLISSGDGIVLSEPPSDMALRSGPWARTLANVSRQRLVQDYEQTRDGLLAFLDKARSPYV